MNPCGTRTVSLLLVGLLLGSCGDQDRFEFQELTFYAKGDCSVSLAGNPVAGTVTEGTTVAFTATGSCITGTAEYHISAKYPDGLWRTLKAWNTTNTYNWDTTELPTGTYRFLVKVRAVGSGDAWAGYDFTQIYTVVATSASPCVAALLSALPTSPSAAGTTVTFTGMASCPGGGEYRFVQRDPAGVWRQVQGWTSSQSFTWNTGAGDIGYSVFYFYARQPGSATPYEAYAGPLHYAINSGQPCTSATLAASPSSPQPLGTNVDLTAASSCTSGVEYRFVAYKPDTTYVQLRGWGDNTHTWNTTGVDIGTWSLQVYSRATGSTSSAEGISAKTPYIVGTGPASLISIGTNSGDSSLFLHNPINANGRYVVFQSPSPDLVFGDSNGVNDVFLADRAVGTISRISLTDGGAQMSAGGSEGAISDNGRYIVFSTTGAVETADTNGVSDIYRYDRSGGTYTRISNQGAGTAHAATLPNLSSNGLVVTWQENSQVLWLDTSNAGNTERRVDTDSVGVGGNGACYLGIDLSSTGRYVAFTSDSSNLVPGDTNASLDIFRKDMTTGAVVRVSVTDTGAQVTAVSGNPAISDDGDLVAFSSNGTLISGMSTGGLLQAYLHRVSTGAVTAVSVNGSGAWGNALCAGVKITGDGSIALFTSAASNLVTGDSNGNTDVFRRNISAGTTVRVTLDTAAGDPDGDSGNFGISRGGDYAVFDSVATDLVTGDSNSLRDVFFSMTP